MIDVDAIAKECERMIDEGCGHLPVIGCGKASEVAELIVMLRDAQNDAVRYRWLRDKADGYQLRGCMELNGADWDVAVDRVMKCER